LANAPAADPPFPTKPPIPTDQSNAKHKLSSHIKTKHKQASNNQQLQQNNKNHDLRRRTSRRYWPWMRFAAEIRC
jgi:hypothetical protein